MGNPGDVVLIDFPFSNQSMSKLRPALVIADAGDGDLLLARITTRPSFELADVFVSDWQRTGLLQPSWARMAKIALLEGAKIRRTIGTFSPTDSRNARESLLSWLQVMALTGP